MFLKLSFQDQRGKEALSPSTPGQPTPSRRKTSPKVPATRLQHRATTEPSKDSPATVPAAQAVGLRSANVDVTAGGELVVAGTRMEVAKDSSKYVVFYDVMPIDQYARYWKKTM